MVQEIFTNLTLAMSESAGIALTASFTWGILSIILSPCHLAAIPLIVAFVGAQGDKIGIKRAFCLSALFSLGILITIALIGVITSMAGMIAGDLGIWGNLMIAVIFIVIGLHLIGLLPMPFLQSAFNPKYKKKGYWASFMLGLVFGIALGPCTFAFMAPVLAAAFGAAAENPVFSALLVLAYAAGHCIVIVIAGTFTELVEKYLHWGENSGAVNILKKICGAFIILAGIYTAAAVFA
ncbi:MAG: cytochrome c biogenesis CcdA family protein [Candidatus Goldiibacteriota bacterium]